MPMCVRGGRGVGIGGKSISRRAVARSCVSIIILNNDVDRGAWPRMGDPSNVGTAPFLVATDRVSRSIDSFDGMVDPEGGARDWAGRVPGGVPA